MFISEIAINNFRIYKDSNVIDFSQNPEKNVYVVSGFNGYGKTTFLTALVWCLYGKHMRDVDSIFKEKILDAGGYSNFLENSINRLSKTEGSRTYSVCITLVNVDIPGMDTNKIRIHRSFSLGNKSDDIQIFIDGYENELINEIGNDLFIQDFILPKEIAKFFFFDAEKITSIAEIKSTEEKRQLSQAYSEVLGIKKYEDLKRNLSDIRVRFRKDSASPDEKARIIELEKKIKEYEQLITLNEEKLRRNSDDTFLKNAESNSLQEKLIREGSSITLEKLKELKDKKEGLEEEQRELRNRFKEMLDLAPFAIAGDLFFSIEQQLEKENTILNRSSEESVLSSINLIAKQLQNLAKNETAQEVAAHAKKLMEQHLVQSTKEEYSKERKVSVLHDFTQIQTIEFKAIGQNLRSTYKETLKDLNQRIKRNKSALTRVSNTISKAESREKDGLIGKIRNEKSRIDTDLLRIQEENNLLHQENGAFINSLNAIRAKFKELQKKVQVGKDYEEKDLLTERLILELEAFVSKMKLDKKGQLEEEIKKGLNTLMHKSNFVDQVSVTLEEGIMDIELYNARFESIEKENLSMGEKQLYATAILQALVKESDIDFPLFIDSPMQKLDTSHAQNIIQDFYPHVSKQVVILPLLGKELTEIEYGLLKDKVQGTYLIKSVSEDQSTLEPIQKDALFQHINRQTEIIV
ncbi:DNA sulfur modification protein DndD [Pontibacter sp. G13]|uniref:DNA sulfur modification protein DndD n=1 Tax=Pontibacter sp. G13 TaxID=3074898 RepID=UPI00288B83FA|nr:DNA sulfur modification protein DndD [Pontibacter sp. G13]WNJ17167.1 DNA sulfur modification protein DndD [Pontibacter sp. G13]